MNGATLVVLGRSPAPGVGKTRLRRHLGDGVDALCDALMRDTLGWAAAGWWDMIVAYCGAPSRIASLLGPDTRLLAQRDGDLGERIDAAIEAAFASGGRRVVLIGTDSPTLPAALLDDAFEGLTTSQATVIPAHDGGWVALGVTAPLEGCLTPVRWSASTTCADTVRALLRSGREVVMLPPWYDVDEIEDLVRLAGELHGGGRWRAPACAALANRMGSALAAAARSTA